MAVNIALSGIKNITEYPNTFKRQGAFPLERYSLFNTLAEAQAYASSNPIAYIGQIVTVVTQKDGAADTVKSYVIGKDSQLVEFAQGSSNPDAVAGQVQAAGAVELPEKTSITLYGLYDTVAAIRNALAGTK